MIMLTMLVFQLSLLGRKNFLLHVNTFLKLVLWLQWLMGMAFP